MKNFWDIVNKVISDADVLLLLLDSRLINETRHKEIEDRVKKSEKPLIYVITKSDLVNKNKLDISKKEKELYPCVFVSATEHLGTTMLRNRILMEAKKASRQTNSEKNQIIKVGVLGYPNVGKSSLINALKGRKSAGTSNVSGYTKGLQNIKADNKIMLIDTPGVIPYKEKDYVKHSFIGTIDFMKSKEPDIIAMKLMENFPGIIEKYYDVEINEDREETLIEIAEKKNIFKRGREPDLIKTGRFVLKDWQKGNIKQD